MQNDCMVYHIPTMMLMIIAASAILALSVGWIAYRQEEDGLKIWAMALVTHTLAFILLGMRGQIPDWVSIVVANVLLTGVYSLMLAAIARFQMRTIPDVLLWGPLLVTAAVFSYFQSDISSRIVGGGLIFSLQIALVFYFLDKGERIPQEGGRYLLNAGMAIMLAIFAYRITAVASGSEVIQHLMRESTVQTLTFLGAFATLVLTSNGFLLMIKERADERVRESAMSDSLTGAWNRMRFEELARSEMARLSRYAHPVSLIMADLDRFKRVNDNFGHAAGDMVLRDFARIVKSCIRSNDALGRWGGEEFLILLPHTDAERAVQLAERIRSTLEQWDFPGIGKVTASFGVAVCRLNDTLESWANRADQAMYAAKAKGRNRVETEDTLP